MKKILAVLLASTMAASALVGCGGNGDSSSQGSDANSSSQGSADASDSSIFGDEDDIVLKVWAPEAAKATFEEQCKDFVALYPDKKISVTVDVLTEAEVQTQVSNAPAKAADVFGFPSDHLRKLVDSKLVSPIPEAFAEDVKANNSEVSVNAVTDNGTMYAYPETGDNGYYLVYDNTVVSAEQAGSLESILEACKAQDKDFIMEVGNGYYACTFAFTGGLKTDGIEYIDGEATQKFVEYDEAEVVATLQAFSKLMHDYKDTFKSLSIDAVSSGFINGTCGAGVDGSWNTVANQKALGDKFGVAKLPTIQVNGEAKQMVPMLGYKFMGVNSATKFPRAAHILANYLTGEECQRERAEKLGWGPTNNTVSGEPVVTDNPAIKAINEQAAFAVPQVNVSSKFWTPMGTLGDKIIAAETDPSDEAFFKKLLSDVLEQIYDL